MEPMYPGIPFSPLASLTDAVGEAASVIPVDNPDAFPPPPSYATIGADAHAETIYYAAKTDAALSGCVRGVEGAARAWSAGETISRNFTAQDHADLIGNVEAIGGALAAHEGDSASHVTQAEKDAWSAKETPQGAQEKADAAELAAREASRPNTWTPTAAEIGAAEAGHTHTTSDITDLQGSDHSTVRVRGISAGTEDLTAGTSDLENGTIYLVYE